MMLPEVFYGYSLRATSTSSELHLHEFEFEFEFRSMNAIVLVVGDGLLWTIPVHQGKMHSPSGYCNLDTIFKSVPQYLFDARIVEFHRRLSPG
jgi:hypothetical protein